MNNGWKDLSAVLQKERNSRLLRKSFIYYLLVFFIVCSGIDLEFVHFLRSNYLRGLYSVIPVTRDFGVGVIWSDYYRHLNPQDPEGWSELARNFRLAGDLAEAKKADREAARLRRQAQSKSGTAGLMISPVAP